MKWKFKVMKKTTRILLVIAMTMTVFLPMGVIAFENQEQNAIQHNKEVEYTINHTVSTIDATATIKLAVMQDPSLVLKECKTYDGQVIDFASLTSQEGKYVIENVVKENKEYTYSIYYQAMVVENDIVNYVDKEKTVSITIEDIPKVESNSIDNFEPISNLATEPRATTFMDASFTYEIISGTNNVAVTGKADSAGDSLVIPKTVTNAGTTYNVTAIANEAFYRNYGVTLTSITIPDSITSIGDYAFKEVSGLKNVFIPNSVQTFGKGIFQGAKDLSIPRFESGITEIADSMFRDTPALTEIIQPMSITKIGDRAFYNSGISQSGLTLIDGTTIGTEAYAYCQNIDSMVIPEGAILLGSGHFKHCSNLISVTFYEGLSILPQSIFMDCPKLTNIDLPMSLVTIRDQAFQRCTGLTSIQLPENLTTIAGAAFSSCTSLKNITLPSKLNSIGGSSFRECTSLKDVVIPDSVTQLGTGAFYLCSSLQEVTLSKNIILLEEQAFRECTSLTTVNIPADSNLQTIAGYAFYGCTALSEVTIPETVKKIMIGAYFGCTSLTTVNIPSTVATFEEAAFRNLPSNVKFYITSSTVLPASQRTSNAAKAYLMSDYWGYNSSDNTEFYYYTYDPTGSTGNIFFTDIIKMDPVGDTTLHVAKGSTFNLGVDIATNNDTFVTKTATWTLVGATDSSTVFTMDGDICKMVIGANETGTMTLTATSDYDASKTVVYTIHIASGVTVTFDTNGGSVMEPVTVDFNKTITQPTDPTRPGYTFMGWYTDNTYTTPWIFATDKVTSNITLYAKWEVKDCTVSFVTNGITVPVSIPNQIIKTGGKITKPVNPARAGYTFAGWYSDSDCTMAWDFDNDTVLDTMSLYAKWIPLSWTVSFDSDGGDSIADEQVLTGGKVTKPTDPTKPGYIFAGWYKDNSLSQQWDFDNDTIIGNTTLYAKWNIDGRTVTFNSNGGTAIANQIIGLGQKVTKPSDPTKSGYTFVGWYKESTLTTLWDFDTDTISVDTTLYAKWEAKEWTVSFTTNGGSSIASIMVKTGDKIIKPTDPTRSGYTFAGWYSDIDLQTPWNFTDDTVNKNMTLYAKWTVRPYIVTFDSNSGNYTPDNQNINSGDKITKPVDPTKVGYTFGGWYINSEFTVAWDFSNDVVTGDMTLYAKWEVMKFTVTFNTDGGSSIGSALVANGQKVTKPADPIKSGYIFMGWYTDENFNTVWDFASDLVSNDMTLYAKWEAGNSTIIFNSNGGSTILDMSVKTGEKITKPTNPTRDGYIFGGWYKENTFITPWDFANDTVKGDMTLYAKWELTDYTVSFKMNGITIPSILPNQSIKSGDKITEPVTPVRTGYTFGGWYSDSALTTKWDFANDTVTSSMTLYAKWDAMDWTVTFNSNGGSSVASITAKTDQNIIKPADPTKVGYSFGGWYKESTLTTLWDFTNDVVTGNTTLYAKWVVDGKTVTFDTNGGSAIANVTVGVGEKLVKPTDPIKAGYTFAGWYKDSGLTTLWNFDSDVVSSDMTLYAKWDINGFTVSFVMNGVTIPSVLPNQTITFGDKIVEPVSPVKTGYTFAGWYSDSALTTAWNFASDTVSSDMTLYAKWDAMDWTVSFDSDGGSNIVDVTVKTDQKVIRPTDPTKTGFTFAGWYTDNTYTTLWDFDHDVIVENTTLYAKWIAGGKTVSFDSMGGSAISNQTVAIGSTISKPVNPTKAGYTFSGWYVDSTYTTEWDFASHVVTTDTTLYAKWVPANNTIIFNSNGGSVVVNQIVLTGDKITQPTNPTKNGYSFGGWYKESSFTTIWDFANDVVSGGDMTLYAKWVVNPFTITFDSNGGNYTPMNQSVEAGKKISKPTNPTKSGYAFVGWYSDSTLTTAWDFDSDTVSSDLTLYAKWDEVGYTITFDSNGGSHVANAIVKNGYKIDEPTIPTKTGYIFVNWYRDSALNSIWDFANDTVHGDMTLYAKWEAKDNTITFNSNGGSAIANATVKTGNTIDKPVDPTRNGYTFIGWYADSTYTTLWDFTNNKVSADVTLYAKWAANTYTVSFELNGVTIPSHLPNQSVFMDGLVNKPVDPVRSGYSFAGWYSDSALTTVWNFASDTVSGNMTLYAKWEAKENTVTFNTNGGSLVASIIVKTDEKVTKPIDPIKKGYDFVGWYKDSDCLTAWDFTNDIVSGNMTLYAKWEASDNTITFDSNGGSIVANAIVKTEQKITKPVDPIKDGYIFGGWYKESTLTTPWTFSYDVVKEDITLYAKWVVIPCYVDFNSQGGNYTPETQIIESGESLYKPIAPSKQGYIFKGWTMDVTSGEIWDFNTKITKNMTLHAVWKVITEEDIVKTVQANIPSGAVKKGTKVSLSVATVDAKIYYTIDGSEPMVNGKEYIEPITINDACTIKAYAIKEGMMDSPVATYQYTIKTTGDVTITVDVDNSDVMITVPNDEVILDAVLTPEDKKAYEQGQDIIITLDCQIIDIPSERIEESVLQGHSIGQYLDIRVYKKIGYNEMVNVHNLNNEIMITIQIPEHLLPKENISRTYKMLRIHEEESMLLDDLDNDLSTITIATDRFSTYVLVYKDSELPIINPDDENIHQSDIQATSDNSKTMGLYFILMCGSLVCMIAVKKKYEC